MQDDEVMTEGSWPEQQFRMCRLQILNWGTFSGLHDIPIAEEGFLFVGRSGSGKSTLLDALSALLIPPAWVTFNAAAREGDRGRHDRDTVSYIRGAWADQKDADSGEIATQYLRPATTWSALAVEYANRAGQRVTLVQLLWLRGSSSRSADVRRHYMIVERSFDIAAELKNFDIDLRRLKQRLTDVHHFETFSAYGEHFRRLLGIESEMALKLLHKTQSAKNLGDLNTFLRDFMLDRPKTFEAAERLVEEFSELDAAHQAVITAREQIGTLRPARDAYQRYRAIDQELVELDQLLIGIDGYRDHCKVLLVKEEIERLRAEDEGLEGQEHRQEEACGNFEAGLALLEKQHRDQGGERIEELERQKEESERQRDARLKKRSQAEIACKQLDWALPDSPAGYAQVAAQARETLEGRREATRLAEGRRDSLRDQSKDVERQFSEVRKEVEALQRQPSNIPYEMLALRQQISSALGIAEGDLSFVGELIEVKKEALEWRGAIERVLHGFALSLLVHEDHYASVSDYVNKTKLNQRLVYHKISADPSVVMQSVQNSSLAHKLSLKDSIYRPWLESELKLRFDYACVENMRDFRQIERAITRQGQIRHGKSRHEKNDRYDINDRSKWVLGFDNREKRRLYEERAQQLAQDMERIKNELKQLQTDRENWEDRLMACQTLASMQWQEIDIAGPLDRIREITNTLDELRRGNRALRELGGRIQEQKEKLKAAQKKLGDTKAERISIGNHIKQCSRELEELLSSVASSVLADQQRERLKERFESLNQPLTLKNLDSHRTSVERGIRADMDTRKGEQGDLKQIIIKSFGRFLSQWKEHSSDLDDTLMSAPEFIALLERLERDDLPKHEKRFFDMLRERSTEQLSALNTHLSEARKEIRDRMELVNEGLTQAEFNTDTRLEIVVNERHLDEVAKFRQQIKQVLENAWLADREDAEARFNVLRELVKLLGSADSDKQRWREQVLDVRQHVEFMARELSVDGREVEVYRSGAGKSGGQREKLATTCLAAALRYQLGGSDGGLPLYAPVILDEAFGKADNEFTELGIKIFAKFGFQLIVATPLKSVMTLEPFIGGACFVDISDRKRSGTLLIEYDREQRRLNLPEKARGQIFAS